MRHKNKPITKTVLTSILMTILVCLFLLSWNSFSLERSELPKLVSLAFNEVAPVKINEIKNLFANSSHRYDHLKNSQLPVKYAELIDKVKNRVIIVKPAGWAAYYVCPTSGVRLVPLSLAEHKCPVDGEIYSAPQIISAYMFYYHNENADAALASALLYSSTNDKKYLNLAENIIVTYANSYKSLPIHDYLGNVGDKALMRGAKLFAQTLDEANWAIRIALAYDIIQQGILDTDKLNLINDFLHGISDTIKRNDMMMSNWQAWHSAAVGVIGFATKDPKLVYDALYGQRGFCYLLSNGVAQDGFWWEGSFGYHLNALKALNILAETSFLFGLDLYNEDFKKMFFFPLKFVIHGAVPTINDSGNPMISSWASLYDSAFIHYSDTQFRMAGHEKEIADYVWTKKLRAFHPIVNDELVLSDDFIRIKKKMAGRDIDVVLDVDTQEGGHKHGDMEELLIYIDGKPLLTDYNPPSYGIPAYTEWYLRSFAHNTITIDERWQPIDLQSPSVEITRDPDNPATVRAVHLSIADLYPGTIITRKVYFDDKNGVIVDVMKVDSTRDHVYDLFYHINGRIAEGRRNTNSLNPFTKYKYLKDTYSLDTPMISIDHSVIPVHFFNLSKDAEQYVSQGPAQRPDILEPVITQRVIGQNAYYINCFCFSTRIAKVLMSPGQVHLFDGNGQLVNTIIIDPL